MGSELNKSATNPYFLSQNLVYFKGRFEYELL